MSTSLRRRVQRLEASLQRLRGSMPQASQAHTAGQQSAAASAIFDVLEAHYGQAPAASDQRLQEAAARIQAGEVTQVDSDALAALPEWALRIMAMTSREALIAVGTLDTWQQANGITHEDLVTSARGTW